MGETQTVTSGYGKKAIIVFGLMLALWLAILLLRLVVYDRQSQAQVAADDIAASWGAQQVIAGPFLQHDLIPLSEKTAVDHGRLSLFTASKRSFADAQLETQARKRGVHEVTVYTAQLRLDAVFGPAAPVPAGAVLPGYSLGDQARVAVYVQDVSGLEGLPVLRLGEKSLQPYTLPNSGGYGGTWLAWDVPSAADLKTLQISARMRGVQRLSLLPGGANNEIEISGDWPHPSFDGARLPDASNVTQDGFKGRWEVSAIALAMPQAFTNHRLPNLGGKNIGVSLLPDVDPYKMLDRATKYGLLVVALTFLVLFLFEVRGGQALHPIPYLLMGSALVLFFMSVLSLAEYLPFWLAYALSAAIIIVMVGSYARAVLAQRQQVITLSACLAGLYALLYIVLKLQDFAMIGGTALLIAALGGTMYITRDIDWNRVNAALAKDS